MLNNIIFVGGIHGVGKSTICKEICNKLDINYLSASDLLKWKEVKENPNEKNVIDIPQTQERLIQGLQSILKDDEKYILDGHFCLFDEYFQITRIPFKTFELIKPILITVVIGDIQLINKRLSERDAQTYSVANLQYMQDEEIIYSKEVADKLKIDHIEILVSQYDKLINLLKPLL